MKNFRKVRRLSAEFTFAAYPVLSRSRLNAILYVLEHYSCEEENERQIPLALYIRLELFFYNSSLADTLIKGVVLGR